MDKDVAVVILSLAKATEEIIGKLYSEVEKIYDNDLKVQFNSAVSNLMGSTARDLIFPVEKIYPDLIVED